MINGRAGIRTSGFPPRPDLLLLDYSKAAVSLADLPCGVWYWASLKLALWPSPAASSVLAGLPHTHALHPELLKGVTWRASAVAHSLPGGAREWRPIEEAPEPVGSLRSCGGGERMVMDEEQSGGGAERTGPHKVLLQRVCPAGLHRSRAVAPEPPLPRGEAPHSRNLSS